MKNGLIETILTYALASAPMRQLKNMDDGFRTRAQLNVFVVAPFGMGKSSMFREIEEKGWGIRLLDYTLPGVVGTINKKGDFTPGFVIKASGSALLIDEFQKFQKREKEALLSLMEDGFFRRTLGYRIQVPYEVKDKYYHVKALENFFEIEVRETYIVASMDIRKGSLEDRALLSRTFPIILDANIEEALELFLDGSTFQVRHNISKLRAKLDDVTIYVPREVRSLVAKKFQAIAGRFNLEPGFLVRGMWNIIRIAGVMAGLDNEDAIKPEHVREALRFAPIQLFTYSLGKMTPKELAVYSSVTSADFGKTPTQVIHDTGLPESTVKKALAKLSQAGLLVKYAVGKNTIYVPTYVILQRGVGE